MKKVLGKRVMIRKYSEETKSENSDMVWSTDSDALPRAEVVMVSDEVAEAGIVSVGDHVYFTEPREKGRCTYQGKEHYILTVDNLVAIL